MVRDLLIEIKEYIIECGWTQGVPVDKEGKVCLQHALSTVVGYSVHHNAVRSALLKEIFREAYRGIVDFNDTPSRTKEEIFDLLDRTIANAPS